MANQSTIQIIIDGDNIKAVNAISGVETKMKKLDDKARGTAGVFGEMSNLISNHLGAISFGALITGFGAMVKSAYETTHELGKLSEKLGISIESLSAMKYAAEVVDVPLDSLTTAIGKFEKNVYQASKGNAEINKSFKDLGINIKDSGGQLYSANNLMLQVSDKFSKMDDGVRKTALAMELFGRGGKESIPYFNLGAEAISRLTKEANDLGLIIHKETAAQMEELHHKMMILEANAKGLANSFIQNFGPALSWAFKQLGEGLDVVFGRAQLINGVQFRDPILGLQQMDAYTQTLVKSTKEWREEEIKTFEAKILMLEAEVKKETENLNDIQNKFNTFGTGWNFTKYIPILPLQAARLAVGRIADSFSDSDDKAALLLRTSKDQLSVFRQQLEIIKNYGKDSSGGFDEAGDALKKLNGEYEKSAEEMTFQNSLFGLTSIEIELIKIEKKYFDERQKIHAAPLFDESLIKESEILEKLQALMKAAKPPEDFIKKMVKDIKSNMPGAIDFLPDDKILEEKIAKIKEQISNLSTEEIATFVMMQEETAAIFGSMADSLMISFQTAGGASEAWFNTYKAMKIAETLIATYSSAEKSYDWAAAWGGPVAGAIAAAVAIGAGLARVGQITSVGPGSVSGGGGSGSNGYTMPQLPSSITNLNNNTNNNATTVTNTIVFQGPVLDVQATLRKYSNEIRTFFKDGNVDIKFNG